HGQEIAQGEIVGRQEREDDNNRDQCEKGPAFEQQSAEINVIANYAKSRALGGGARVGRAHSFAFHDDLPTTASPEAAMISSLVASDRNCADILPRRITMIRC